MRVCVCVLSRNTLLPTLPRVKVWLTQTRSFVLVFFFRVTSWQRIEVCYLRFVFTRLNPPSAASFFKRQRCVGNGELNRGHRQSANMCHLNKSVNLCVCACNALRPELHFLHSFPVCLSSKSCSPGVSRVLGSPLVAQGSSARRPEMYSLSSTLGHSVDGGTRAGVGWRGARCRWRSM